MSAKLEKTDRSILSSGSSQGTTNCENSRVRGAYNEHKKIMIYALPSVVIPKSAIVLPLRSKQLSDREIIRAN